MIAVAVSAGATALTFLLLARAARNLARRGRGLPPQRLPGAVANLIGLVAFLAGMAIGHRFWP